MAHHAMRTPTKKVEWSNTNGCYKGPPAKLLYKYIYISMVFIPCDKISQALHSAFFLQPWTRQVDQRYFTTGRMNHGGFVLVSGRITCQWPQLRWWRQSAWQPSGFWGANRNCGGWFVTYCIFDSMGCRELLSSMARKWLGSQRQFSRNEKNSLSTCLETWYIPTASRSHVLFQSNSPICPVP